MAVCGSLSSLFEKPRPENPTLIESLSSWNQIMPKKPVDNACFTEIFGELHFQEKPSNSVDLPDLSQKRSCTNGGSNKSSFESLFGWPKDQRHSSDAKSLDKLQLCTERLGSESSDDVDDLVEDSTDDCSAGHWKKEKIDAEKQQAMANGGHPSMCSDVRPRTGGFPPPISSIGKSGKPWICLKSYRGDGRFVLREIRIPTVEFLRASREDGRLKLQLVHPHEAIPEGDEAEPDKEEEEETEISQGSGLCSCQFVCPSPTQEEFHMTSN